MALAIIRGGGGRATFIFASVHWSEILAGTICFIRRSTGVVSHHAIWNHPMLSQWRLKDDRGCQTWHYLESDEELKAWPQTAADKHFLGLETVSPHRLMQPPWMFSTMVSSYTDIRTVGPTQAQACEDTSGSRLQWRIVLLRPSTTPG